ncbi:ROK family protein [Candidatus Saccharibacteria bacterium]|nr:ROK family protein [Candidatus Saccharibacteria bacterium]
MIVAIDVGGTKTRFGLAYSSGEIFTESVMPTPQDSSTALLEVSRELARLSEGMKIDAIGVACPGAIDKPSGMILDAHNVPWRGLNIVQHLGADFDCQVVLENDAAAGGIAEARLGAGCSARLVVFMTISTGVGMSIILDGKLLPTRHNSEGGAQVISLRAASGARLETLISGPAIEQKYGMRASEITDPKVWDEIAQSLSAGIFNIITIVQPDVIVLAGGVSRHYAKFITPLNAHLLQYNSIYPLPEIKQARFVETAPVVGMLLLAQDHIAQARQL